MEKHVKTDGGKYVVAILAQTALCAADAKARICPCISAASAERPLDLRKARCCTSSWGATTLLGVMQSQNIANLAQTATEDHSK